MESVTLTDALQSQVLAALGRNPLFRALKPEHLPQVVKVAELVRCDDAEVIVKQGDASDDFFVIVAGEAAVMVDKGSGESFEIGRIPNPASIGEIGLLLSERRTASVVSAGETLLLRFGHKAFDQMFQKIPNFGIGLAQGLAYRLQDVSGKIPLPAYELGDAKPGPEVLGVLPLEFITRHRVLPIKVEAGRLTLGFVDDPTTQVMNAVRTHAPGLEVRPVRIEARVFDDVLRGYSGAKGWAGSAAADVAAVAPEKRSPRLDALLERMVAEGASDLHLSAGFRPHWRIDGDMSQIADAPVLGPNQVFELIEPVMEKRHREQFLADSDTDLAYNLPGVARFRVNVFRDHRGVGAVLRQIPSKIQSLEQLGMPPVLTQFCDIPKGLILVTGPTGSGKSTTLAAMIDLLNRTKKAHIVTVEDPIEFVHGSQQCLINQREVGGHTTSFARALRAALREDPDIVLVGEMRDLETVTLALETANTGHLVFATLHTNTAISAVDRIVDMFPADQQEQIRTTLADVLRGVVAQNLCKKIGGGRLAVLEILVVNLAISNLIRESKTVQVPSMMQAGRAAGMQLLNDELTRLIEAKKLDFQEALSKAVDKEDLTRRFRAGIQLVADPPAMDRFRVVAVQPGAAAAEGGFQRGDLIAEVDQRPAKEFTLDEMRQLFRVDGRHIYGVDRAGQNKRIKITFELKR